MSQIPEKQTANKSAVHRAVLEYLTSAHTPEARQLRKKDLYRLAHSSGPTSFLSALANLCNQAKGTK